MGTNLDPRLKYSQSYGARPGVYAGAGLSGHEGIDYMVKENTPIYSPISGTVEMVGDNNDPIMGKSYGNYVFIRGENGDGILIGHNNKVNVRPGQKIKPGDQVSFSGSTGFSESPHLHISYTKDFNKAKESMTQFQKTGVHKYRDGGFANPESVLNDEYANSLISPKALLTKPGLNLSYDQLSEIKSAGESASLSSPSTRVAEAKPPSVSQVSQPGQSNDVVESIVSQIPEKSKASARQNIPLIIDALQEQGILTPRVLSYALATIAHETAGTFQPIEEYGGRAQARKLGYKGGEDYFGRGFIQLTHDYNYDAMGKRLGVDLLNNPQLALDPKTSARIMAVFFKDRNVANLSETNFAAARNPINPDDRGPMIANNANKFYKQIATKKLTPEPKKPQIAQVNQINPERLQQLPGLLKNIMNVPKAQANELPFQKFPMPRQDQQGQPKAQLPTDFIQLLSRPKQPTGLNFPLPSQAGKQPVIPGKPQTYAQSYSKPTPQPQPGAQNSAYRPPSATQPKPTSYQTSSKPNQSYNPPKTVSITVKPGQTLSQIAQQVLGNANRWKEIQGYSGDPRKLPVGQKLTIKKK